MCAQALKPFLDVCLPFHQWKPKKKVSRKYLYFLLANSPHQGLIPHVIDNPPPQHLLGQAGAHHAASDREDQLLFGCIFFCSFHKVIKQRKT